MGRPKGSRDLKSYLTLSARDAVAKIGEKSDPFLYMARCIARDDATSFPAARHLSTFIEPQISRTEISGPDSNALTINFNFDAMPTLSLKGGDMIDVTPALSEEITHDEE